MPSLAPSTEETSIYEIAVLYPALSQKDEQALLKEVEGFFSEAGGVQIARDLWGRRGLAYSMKGANEGCFVIYYYELEPGKIREIDHNLKIEKNVLRHLIVKPPKGYQIVKYSEAYEQWLKERETVEQVRAREHEEHLKEHVAKKAKQQARRTDERKKAAPAKAIDAGELTERLDKLIADDTLGL